MDVSRYYHLHQQHLESVLDEAVNEALEQQPDDPVVFIANQLLQKASSAFRRIQLLDEKLFRPFFVMTQHGQRCAMHSMMKPQPGADAEAHACEQMHRCGRMQRVRSCSR